MALAVSILEPSDVVAYTQDRLGGPGGGESAHAGDRPPALPCLSSHNSNKGGVVEGEGSVEKLTGSHKRSAHCLALEVVHLAERFGVEKVGFLTLTFPDQVVSLREANRRFNSLNVRVLKVRYRRAICVPERQKSGRVHFHLVVAGEADIRSGFDFGAATRRPGEGLREFLARRPYASANAALREEWAFWRKTGPKYGFGRTELLPVRSTMEAIGRYVGSYVSKHVGARVEFDKGSRLVRYLGYKPGDRRARPQFAWNTLNSWLWREKLRLFAGSVRVSDTDSLVKLFGPRWSFFFQRQILDTSVDVRSLPGGSFIDRARFVQDRLGERVVIDNLVQRESGSASDIIREWLTQRTDSRGYVL